MKQVLTSARTGDLELVDVPPPALVPGGIRMRTAASLLSAGTERMILDLASKSYLGKAQARPDLVKQVLDKVRKEGLVNTWRNVQSKLEKPMPLGYSAAGIIEAVDAGVEGFSVGDRVAVAGAGYANHAEINSVPKNLVARIPDEVSFEDASYSTVAAIALQGVRLAKPELGDNVVVIGLGLIGIITVQLLKANGCRVFGTDLDPTKVDLAKSLGMDDGIAGSPADTIRAVDRFTRGRGADHTLITAATDSDGPIELAGEVTRRKGQVVAVGAIGMGVPRNVYYMKEISIQISMSYGPGRYDASYEEGGVDYPYDYVRWTEQRNLEAVLDLMAQGSLDVSTLTTHRFPLDDALDAYKLIQEGTEPHVGVVLTYDVDRPQSSVVQIAETTAQPSKPGLRVGFVGAGNYAALHLIPHLSERDDVTLSTLVTATGLNARQKGERFGFESASTDIESILTDSATDAVFIGTRHGTHADFSARALQAGKHVFVEKPLVAVESQLSDVIAAYEAASATRPTALMVGLNRRFAPMTTALKAGLPAGPKHLLYRVNSGAIPTSTWLHEESEGGGMMVGEMCHFIDLMMFVCGERPVRAFAESMSVGRSDLADSDNVTITIRFDGGSVGTLVYTTVGDKAMPKERLEVAGAGAVGVLDDFRRLTVSVDGQRSKKKAANQDKGQGTQVAATVEAFRRGTSPIPFQDLVDGMRTVFAARRSLATGQPEPVHPVGQPGGDGVVADAAVA